jgi:hypothetical protein
MCFGQVDLNMNFLYQLRTKPRSESLGPDEFTAVVVKAYKSFIADNLIPRTVSAGKNESSSVSSSPLAAERTIPPPYIQTLFISTALMPVVENDQLMRFVDKYRDQGADVPAGVVNLEDIVDICGIEVRRKMVEEFNTRMVEFAQSQREAGYNVKCVDINQYITGSLSISLYIVISEDQS